MDFFSWKTKKKTADCPLDAETHIYMREDLASERIIDADFIALVALPASLDCREWIATHTVAFVEHIGLLYGTVLEFCTPTLCPAMSVPAGVLTWTDEKGRKIKCSATEYCDNVVMFCQKCVSDETQFPTKYGNKFPPNFDATLKRIYRLLSHVLAHLYHSHYRHMMALGINGCLNTLTYHLALLLRAHNICSLTSSIASSTSQGGANTAVGGATEDRELSFVLQLSERLHRPIIVEESSGEALLSATRNSVARETTPIVPMSGEEFQERGIDIAEIPKSKNRSVVKPGSPAPIKSGSTSKPSSPGPNKSPALQIQPTESAATAVKNGATAKNSGGTKPEMGRLRQAMAGLTSRKENGAN